MLRIGRGLAWNWCVAAVLGLTALGVGPTARAEESWDAVYLSGSKVGHIHTFIEPVKDKGRALVRVRVDMALTFKRLRDKVTMQLQYGTIETPEGEVLRLDTRTLVSDQEMRVHGDVIDGKMNLVMDGTGQRQQQQLDWGIDVRGPYASEQSLSRVPIKPGESRTLRMFVPDVNRVCDMTLTAKSMEDVPLGGGTNRSLLRVEQTSKLDGKSRPEFNSTLWVDSGGQVLKSLTDNFGGMVTYRTTRDGALAPNDPGAKFDQILTSVVKVTHKINRPGATRDVRYVVRLKDENPAAVFPTDRRQTIRPAARPNEAILAVKTAGPDDGAPEAPPADDVFLRPNAMITSQDARVVRLSQTAVAGATDPWEKAKRVERWVAKNLATKNFSVAFAPASEVAQNLTGDCTEHGVLTAAMCRAAGVPARVVVGLVYAENLDGFGFHLWNEVYVNRRWVAIDSTFEQDSVDAVHIKLSDSSLDGVAPFESFLPIVRVMGKLTLEPTEIR